MTTREHLHALVDELPEAALPAVAQYLAAAAAGEIPEDEALSPEEEAMWAASEAAIARGDVLTHDEVLARRAARRERS